MLGNFWRPNVPGWSSSQALPAERVAGQFSTTNDGPWRLELLSSVLPHDDPSLSDPTSTAPNFNVIYGASIDQTCLSLFDAWRSSFTLFGAIQNKETWVTQWYAEGTAWLEPTDEVDLISIEYDLLSDWGWIYEHPATGYNQSEQTFRVPSMQVLTGEVNGAKVTLRFGWDQTLATREYSATAQAVIEIADVEALNNIGNKWVFPIQGLLEFLTLNYVDIKKVAVRPSDLPDAKAEVHYNVHKPRDLDDQKDRSVHPVNMLATRSRMVDCGIDLSTLFGNYFALIAEDDHKSALWFLKESALRLIDKTVDTSLLNAFRALERYHDAAIDGTAIPEAEHIARVATIVAGSPPEHQQWIRDQISGANKKGLRRQLHDVLDRSASTEAKIVEAWPGFFNSIVALRSKVAHGIPTTGSDAALRYLAAATGLRWILRHVYLRELGLSDEDASSTIAGSLAFEQDLRLLKDWHNQLEQS